MNQTKRRMNCALPHNLAILQVLVPHTYDYLPQPFAFTTLDKKQNKIKNLMDVKLAGLSMATDS